MTYRELKEILSKLSEEQLEKGVTVFDAIKDEYYPAEYEDDDHPVIVIKKEEAARKKVRKIDLGNVKKSVPNHASCFECKGNQIKLDERYDAYYCDDCNIWIEPVCRDAECVYCKSRPAKPKEV